MAKVKIELDLDWISEEGDLDSTIKDAVIQNLQGRFLAKVEKATTEMLNAKLAEVAEKVSDDFLAGIMKERIETVQIPHKSSEWGSSVEMMTISEYVGKRYERFLREKVLDEKGHKPDYSRDAKYSVHEYFVNKFLEKELVGKVSDLIKKSRQDAEQTIIKTLESNLKAQLSADMINRLNIPQMLKSLQEKAAEIELNGGSN
ncbi:hypothetical protein [Paenibacillus sp. JDR-2]|uniref:hypothetical protein n=1 Tax=Paenibacillus sp. (strain JDR-2) TaxID=324057 RepID=UPI000166A6C6|nr:hypothetical protein [Paenibacillus sp. JDR-2]ACT00254.1 hypothetical protein Pjdr2_1584 [Paenibacillus sp. JDR-2]